VSFAVKRYLFILLDDLKKSMFILLIVRYDDIMANIGYKSTKWTIMGFSKMLTDDAILAEVGKRIARTRLDHRLTQADLAEQAGISKRTVERIESGASVQMSSFIRVLRGLGLLQGLESLIPKPVVRPMDLLKLKGKVRQRASSKKRKNPSIKEWSWNDEV